ncbi:P1 family peptidase [Peribacillus psychrosaccharolyticus]|uniref:P1 family peptidase n=1 Tax=Peribacillus psychrosaccharolyticus TaxID=1407 RepID=A0A974NP65_PERPY|nr:P1 family peptidase [Peribacillus psychrosaccharolyticus]MEC2054050.1 P1 family peptidase [Peribacillus psychrosaccharolyticus]MED3742335.1 P1 family peptidase [Peribacillus psychrosaccharolyticus]QQT01306.1 P1 family peptidase [Peribacillus psychrosaccharolyticus]
MEKVKGLKIGKLPTGKKNCITDVADVRVGHVTLDFPLDADGEEAACTGVTAILPHGGNIFKKKVTAASYVLNGFGKSTGLVQVNELGVLESPIMLTNTFGVPAVTQGTLEYMLKQNPEIGETTGTINIVVGECNDSHLNSIRQFPVQSKHAVEAILKAAADKAEEGAVGAGKGMICFGFKGGIGTSSRVIKLDKFGVQYTIGCLVLSNFGKEEEFLTDTYAGLTETLQQGLTETSDGSIIIILATDAPLSDRQLLRVIKRCGIGLGRTGSNVSHGSGDIVIGFSTAKSIPHDSESHYETYKLLREDHFIFNQLFVAAAEATEEAILHSLLQAETTKGRKGRIVHQYSNRKEGS